MLGWIIIFAILSLVGFSMGQSYEVAAFNTGYGICALFAVLFTLSLLVRTVSRHSS